jgi:sulfoxide reductase heme-binding subunit YedZ
MPSPSSTLPLPWRDRRGRFSTLKALAFAATLAPGAWLGAQALAGALGPEPLDRAIGTSGAWALRFLLIALAVTPLSRVTGRPRLALLRRMLGLAALAHAGAHFCLYAADQGFSLFAVAREVALRLYLTIGFAALCGLAVLGWTSTDGWMRRLGRRWKRLHRWVHPIALLALVHALLQSRTDPAEALMMVGFFLWLAGWRRLPGAWQARAPALLALAAGAALGTAALEYAWFALATGIPPLRVLMANFSPTLWPRPAVVVAWAGLLMVLPAAVRGWPSRSARYPSPSPAAVPGSHPRSPGH